VELRRPAAVKPGDIAYIVSPSAGIMQFAPTRVERAKSHLESLGLTVKVAENAAKNSGYVSASIEDRVQDLHDAFSDPDCTLIMASIGGNHSNQIISKLDYELIKANPKVFVGYSDNTVLHLALATQAGLQTFYGPCFLNQFGEYPEVFPFTLEHFQQQIMGDHDGAIEASPTFTDEILDWFTNEDSTRARKLSKNSGHTWWKPGECEGWALLGALPSLNHVLGTQYFPDSSGAILFIDVPEGHSMHEGQSVSEVDSWMTDLKNAGVLKKVSGVVIGRPYKYTTEMITELQSVILRICDDYNFPILFNTDIGHTDPMLTIPYGAVVKLSSLKNQFLLSRK
jgi:muramoyltetrapeptide carboxypeptidase